MDEKTEPTEPTELTAEPTVELSDAKKTYVWKAKLALEAYRFDDMAKFMGLVVRTGLPMTKDEDNMLAVAYKRTLDAKRMSRQTLMTIIERSDDRWKVDVARQYRDEVGKELRAQCNEMLSVINSRLSSSKPSGVSTLDPATNVFYWKLYGDYNRYAAEVAVDTADRDQVVDQSRTAYELADELGRHALQPIDPIRLGLMLNYSVFLYQVCNERKRGHDVAKRAFDDAVAELDSIDHTSDDITLILRLIRDNLGIWINENGGSSFDTTEVSAMTSPSS
ncbi:14-3-3 protein,14-3-3 domain [Cinara cedri]|uniref:14-3-3 protein,14-3-3 domain n=1 Tax=Cinara cedri TaxID=506608 RepID=A0A5E4MW65_9HEMI|nr:14-3-3 protein,14-3-3 domain [Cinara cedri]